MLVSQDVHVLNKIVHAVFLIFSILSVLDISNSFDRKLKIHTKSWSKISISRKPHVGVLDFCARAIEQVWPMSGCLWRDDRRRFPWICDKTRSFASAVSAVSIEIRSKRIVIFSHWKRRENLQNRKNNTQQRTGEVWRKLSFQTRR